MSHCFGVEAQLVDAIEMMSLLMSACFHPTCKQHWTEDTLWALPPSKASGSNRTAFDDAPGGFSGMEPSYA
eukprot:1573035-Amphidinium_carterae.1